MENNEKDTHFGTVALIWAVLLVAVIIGGLLHWRRG